MSSNEPPRYSEPLMVPGDGEHPREANDNVPDDFKWSDVVAECSMDIRHMFIRRVYAIFSAQIAVTVAMSFLIITVPSINFWVMSHPGMSIIALIGAMVTMLLAMWKRQSYPYNMVFLSLFTLFEAYIVGLITSLYDTHIVLNAFLITLFVFVGLSAFALQTRYDFTSWAPYLAAALFGLVGFGFVTMFITTDGVELAYSIVAVVVFSGFILVDTQLIQTHYRPDEDVAAAIALYLDVINLFIHILQILNRADNS